MPELPEVALALGAVSGPHSLPCPRPPLASCRPAEPPLGVSAAETPLKTSCRQGEPLKALPLIVSCARLRVEFH